MKTLGKLSFAAALALTAMPAMAQTNDIVRDMWGKPVRDSWGGCVRSMWIVPDDQCEFKKQDRVIYFDFNSSKLTPEAKAKLDSLLQTISNSRQLVRANIIGYADMIGDSKYNVRLSQKRAIAVRDYLASKGFSDSRTDVRGLGEASQNHCKNVKSRKAKIACLAKDRRVEIELEWYNSRY